MKYFPSHRILKSCYQLIIHWSFECNLKWLQVTEVTNGFTFQIINSWMEFWPGLTVIPPSDTCTILSNFCFHSTTVREIWCFSLNFFSLLLAQNKVNKLLQVPVNSLLFAAVIKEWQLELAVFHHWQKKTDL